MKILKQSSLYFDRVVLDDPLLRIFQQDKPLARPATQILGYKPYKLSPQDVARAARYMKRLTPMVAANFLKFFPVRLRDPDANDLPIRFSPTLFAESVPSHFRQMFASRRRIYPMRSTSEGGWAYNQETTLQPCRGLCIQYEGLDGAFVYHLLKSEVASCDDATRIVRMVQWLPDEPSTDAEFSTWVTQSMNQSAGEIVRHLCRDFEASLAARCMICTDQPMIADLLSLQDETDLDKDLANLALKMDVPAVTDVSISNLMTVRVQHGEPFENFRVLLQRELRKLRDVADAGELERRIQEVGHELEAQLHDIRQQMRRIRRELIGEAATAVASLTASAFTGGTSLLGLAAAGVAGYSTLMKYLNEVRSNPAYFLWAIRSRKSASEESGECL